MGKAKSNPPKKEMSEGKAIALSVLILTLGLIAAGYLLKWIISYFFPGLF
ncbi:MAG: hypothetical protein ACNS64_01860 [Candidatus Halalkalibacterium sp. M3_1C_030]